MANINCPKRHSCGHKEEDMWLQGIPEHIVADRQGYYIEVRTYENKKKLLCSKVCYLEARDKVKEIIDSLPKDTEWRYFV
jgi:hypothetical protein